MCELLALWASALDEFSYASELVGHDGAITALTELARVLDLLPGVLDGPWDRASTSLLPDFTIRRPGHPPVFWEHLGMLDRPGYRADWEAKKAWYASNGILPWEGGGGPGGILVCSTENYTSAGIDAHAIEQLAAEVFSVGHIAAVAIPRLRATPAETPASTRR
jgi:hypothetical protein